MLSNGCAPPGGALAGLPLASAQRGLESNARAVRGSDLAALPAERPLPRCLGQAPPHGDLRSCQPPPSAPLTPLATMGGLSAQCSEGQSSQASLSQESSEHSNGGSSLLWVPVIMPMFMLPRQS